MVVRQPVPLFVPPAEQVAREIDRARESTTAERRWRGHLWRVVGIAFATQALGVGVAAAALLVGDEELGWLLIKAGQLGVVAGPALVAVLWITEAHRRGDL